MVSRIVRYACDTCRRGHPSHREASNCEMEHIATNAAKRATESIVSAFERGDHLTPTGSEPS